MDFSHINLDEHKKLAQAIIFEASSKNFKDRQEFEKFRNSIVKKNRGVIFDNLYLIKAYNDLLKAKKIKSNRSLLNVIQKRSVRTLSGVAPVTVLMKAYPCPGRCVYCPTDVRMPKSYIPSQPAAARAFRQKFDPYVQVFVRLKAMQMTGHEISKVELRVIGGTFSAYPKHYQIWFLKRCLQALNEFPNQMKKKNVAALIDLVKEETVKSAYGEDKISRVLVKSLRKNISWEKVVKENEKAEIRCIGINIETRPDFITEKEVKRLRYLGVTKVEMGVQTTDDKVQEITCRGHNLEAVRKATRLLKDAGFKIGYHMMPNLPGSSVALDKKMIAELFKNQNYQPDYLKIYPCVVMPKALLSKWFREGKFKPYDDKTLESVLLAELKSIPEYCRVDRIARDIPAQEIEGGFRVSNIRQILENRLKKEGFKIREIRYREIGNEDINQKNIKLIVRNYNASGGEEYFLSFEDAKKDKLIALLRLRFPGRTFIDELKGAALIREVHVYGRQIVVGEKGRGEKQHLGWGTKLMEEAEKMAKDRGYSKIAVISGIGTREYYKKFGYKISGSYMVKS